MIPFPSCRRPPPEPPPFLRCNTGGPMSRTRTQALHASVFDGSGGTLNFPRYLSVGLDFEGSDPLAAIEELFARAGIDDAEQLRASYRPPAEAGLCRENRELPVPRFAAATDAELLRQVLLLGLCTPHFYDPRRPVLLTRASLGRRLELYVERGFYA